eukprot:CAMPEP_0167768518 /NCGR_PEP_ID=MMETSP0110_2-20121227/16718_1 /TAXON_ID=629695 /ORGANISM="Gymnochlora sp., Strain CCMP2014" /LENGTH=1080 /DNA_ID=CAMNT_0007657213 /DNA_START=184 /DNA_END=3426 /DNA_ORIENTATION=-
MGSSWYTLTTDFYLGFGFLRALNCLIYLEKIELREIIPSRVGRQVLLLVISILAYLFIFSGIIFIVESLGDAPGIDYNPETWTLIVTLSTVGYGDFFATTFLGRLVIICCIFVGIIAFGAKTAELVSIIKSNELGHGNFQNSEFSKFVVVCGELTEESLELMLSQLLHPLRIAAEGGAKTKIIALVPTEKRFKMIRSYFSAETNAENKKGISSQLHLFVGNPVEGEDLARLQIRNAQAVFVLSPENTTKTEWYDLRQLYTAVAIRRYFRDIRRQNRALKIPRVPIKIVVSRRRHWQLYNHPSLEDTRARVDVVCFDKLMMELLASSCFTPGFLSFLLTTTTNIGHSKEETDVADPEWLKTYIGGSVSELHAFMPRDVFLGKDFWAVRDEFTKNEVSLLGYIAKNGVVHLSPKQEAIIPEEAKLIVMSDDEDKFKDLVHIDHPDTLHHGDDGAIGLKLDLFDIEGMLDGYDKVKIVIKQIGVPRFNNLRELSNTITVSKLEDAEIETNLVPISEANSREVPYRNVHLCTFAFDIHSLDQAKMLSIEVHVAKNGIRRVRTLAVEQVNPDKFVKELRLSVQRQNSTNFSKSLARTVPLSPEAAAPELKNLPSLMEDQLEVAFKHKNKRCVLRIKPFGHEEGKTEGLDLKRVNPARESSYFQQDKTQRSVELAHKVAAMETSDGFTPDGSNVMLFHVADGKLMSIKSFSAEKGHIVVFDPQPQNLRYLLQPLKRRQRITCHGSLMKIIIVHRKKLSKAYPDLFNALNLSTNVFWVSNHIRSRRLFEQLYLHNCRTVIVCEHRLEDKILDDTYSAPEDAPAMFLTLRIRQFLDKKRRQINDTRYIPVVTELQTEKTLNFLKYWDDDRSFAHPLFAEGCVVTKTFAQLLLMKSVDNPYIVDIFRALMNTSEREGQAQIYGIPIVQMRKVCNFTRDKWSEICGYFREDHVIPLALYCVRREENGGERRYTITNPKNDQTVTDGDTLIALSSVPPEEVKTRHMAMESKKKPDFKDMKEDKKKFVDVDETKDDRLVVNEAVIRSEGKYSIDAKDENLAYDECISSKITSSNASKLMAGKEVTSESKEGT